ncbi:MAG: hypothetical protein Q8L90_08420 [Bacteroidota bacterium]|nr:hypothetical protein [Bacteroidota bacterium]
MDNISKANSDLNKKIEKIEKEIQPALYEQSLDMTVINQEAEKDLNSKILEITLKIKDQYPELSKYIEEMPVTIPDEKKPEITQKNLKAYYDSLNDVLSKYLLEHPNQ